MESSGVTTIGEVVTPAPAETSPVPVEGTPAPE
jgi:hypothetical protein